MVRFNKTQLVTMVAIILAMLFNPGSYQILKDYIEIFFNVIAGVSTLWIIGFLMWKVLRPEQVNIPKKKKKSQPVFLED